MKKDILFVIIFWIVWYGIMAILGAIEHRTIPLGKMQSRAYFPGDMFVPLMVLPLLHEVSRHKLPQLHNWCFVVIITAITAAIMLFIVKRDHGFYPPRAAHSPSKIGHDAMGFFLMPIAIALMALPLIIEAWKKHITLKTTNIALFVAALVIYLTMAFVVDSIIGSKLSKEEMRRRVYARHPYNWGSGYKNLLEDPHFGEDDAVDPVTGEAYQYGP